MENRLLVKSRFNLRYERSCWNDFPLVSSGVMPKWRGQCTSNMSWWTSSFSLPVPVGTANTLKNIIKNNDFSGAPKLNSWFQFFPAQFQDKVF